MAVSLPVSQIICLRPVNDKVPIGLVGKLIAESVVVALAFGTQRFQGHLIMTGTHRLNCWRAGVNFLCGATRDDQQQNYHTPYNPFNHLNTSYTLNI